MTSSFNVGCFISLVKGRNNNYNECLDSQILPNNDINLRSFMSSIIPRYQTKYALLGAYDQRSHDCMFTVLSVMWTIMFSLQATLQYLENPQLPDISDPGKLRNYPETSPRRIRKRNFNQKFRPTPVPYSMVSKILSMFIFVVWKYRCSGAFNYFLLFW